jgi:hypothetical protein
LIDAMGGNGTAFAVLNLDETESASTTFTGQLGAAIPERAAVERALDYIGVRTAHRRITQHDVSHADLEAAVGGRGNQCMSPHWGNQLVYVLLAQLYHTQQCGVLMEEVEADEGAPFEYVLHVRPDAAWVRAMTSVHVAQSWPMDALITSSTDCRFQDWTAAGPRELMLNRWFRRLDWIAHSCRGWHALDRAMPVGCGLAGHFQEVGVRALVRELPQVVVRRSRTMNTARQACEAKDQFFGDRTNDCLNALYDANNEPRHAQSGSFW